LRGQLKISFKPQSRFPSRTKFHTSATALGRHWNFYINLEPSPEVYSIHTKTYNNGSARSWIFALRNYVMLVTCLGISIGDSCYGPGDHILFVLLLFSCFKGTADRDPWSRPRNPPPCHGRVTIIPSPTRPAVHMQWASPQKS